MTAEIGTQVQIVGDDLLVTNPKVIAAIPDVFDTLMLHKAYHFLTFLAVNMCRELKRRSRRTVAMLCF